MSEKAFALTEGDKHVEAWVWRLMWSVIGCSDTDLQALMLPRQGDAVVDTLDDALLRLNTAQRALLVMGAWCRDLMGHIPAIVCRLALDGTTLFVNDAVTRITGYELGELLGKNWWDILYPKEQHGQVGDLYVRLESGDIANYEMDLRAKDGSLKTLAWNSSNHYQPDGTLESIICFGVDITERKQAEHELKQSLERLHRNTVGVINALAFTVELKDPYTSGHQRRVAQVACAIAKEMGLSEEQVDATRLAGIVHDIGKISVPSEILSKPGKINETEFSLIKAHPQVGYDVLKTIEFPLPIAQILLQHHEMMDGSGYPSGLRGKDILLEARILCVADVVEAMASHRPYRPAMGIGKALEEISRNRDILYDSDVVNACLRVFTQRGFTFE